MRKVFSRKWKILFVIFLAFVAFKIAMRVKAHREAEDWLRQLNGQVALITGSNGGLGQALAKEAASRGMKILLTDIRDEGVEELQKSIKALGGTSYFVKADLSIEKDREKIVETAKKQFGTVHLLFNNAAYGYMTRIQSVNLDDAKKSLDVNFWAGVDLTQRLLPLMMAQPEGGEIVNISSLAGTFPEAWGESTGFYAAAKGALNNWTRVLRQEVGSSNIKVKLAMPYVIKTKFFDRMIGKDVDLARRFLKNLLVWAPYDSPEYVAKDIFWGLAPGTLVILPGSAGYLFSISRFLYPEVL